MQRIVLVHGGGLLGSALAQNLQKMDFKVILSDIHTPQFQSSFRNIKLTGNMEKDSELLKHNIKEKLSAVYCTAGGWVGGGIQSESIFSDSENMINSSLYSSLVSSHIASLLLESKGLLVLTGSYAAFSPTPNMIAYGVAKASVHHLVRSLSNSDQFTDKTVIGLSPITIKPKDAVGDETHAYTPVSEIVQHLIEWYQSSSSGDRRLHGKIMVPVTDQFKTTWKIEN